MVKYKIHVINKIKTTRPEILYQLALEAITFKDWDSYSVHMIMAANLGYPDAIKHIMSTNYFIKQNNDRTKRFYEETQEYSYSLCRLGYMYNNGAGVTEDKARGKQLYKMLAQLGNPNALDNLGTLYEYKQNYKKARVYYEKAMELGHASAIRSLGIFYARGYGVSRDIDKARELFELAVSNGHLSALNNLTRIYRKYKSYKDKRYIIQYFISINHPKRLKRIYKYDDLEIELLVEHYHAMKNNTQLKIENESLRNQIKSNFDGEIFFETFAI